MNAIRRASALAGGALILLVLPGCGPDPAAIGSMVPSGIPATHRTAQPVRVSVSGGSVTSALTGPGIKNEDFQKAVETSLTQSGMFSAVADGGYHLTAFIASLEQPVIGFSMTVNLEVSYDLTRGGKSVWRKSIRSAYEASTGEAFAGSTRLRKATEGAARANITELVRQLNARRP